jgi:AcrR family transcriptional regulator
MAIIVDKTQKRRDIALSCKEIFIEYGIKNLTVSQLAKTAGVGKGTIYDYFKNKEDIVFEIINILIQKRNIILKKEMSKLTLTKEKVKLFASFFYSDEDIELRKLYKEFIAIALASPDEKMIEFQTECFDDYFTWFEEIIEDGIQNGELIEKSRNLTKGLFVISEALFISNEATNSISDLEMEINRYIDAIFELIEVKR